jgi:hypothetical protein
MELKLNDILVSPFHVAYTVAHMFPDGDVNLKIYGVVMEDGSVLPPLPENRVNGKHRIIIKSPGELEAEGWSVVTLSIPLADGSKPNR